MRSEWLKLRSGVRKSVSSTIWAKMMKGERRWRSNGSGEPDGIGELGDGVEEE
jgi:hypothetical protein